MTTSTIKLLCLFNLSLLSSVFGQIFITEIADPNDNASARYIELYNAGNDTIQLDEGDGFLLRRYTNASTSPTLGSQDSLKGTLPPGGFYLVAVDSLEFIATFGISPDQEGNNNGAGDSNGDDNIELVGPSGKVMDVYGVPGTDGTGECHEFEDGRAERVDTVTTGKPIWNQLEWNIRADSEITGCVERNPVNVLDNVFDPGKWIGTPPQIKPEPSFQVTELTAKSIESNRLTVTWTSAAKGSMPPDGYLLIASLHPIDEPVDGHAPDADLDITDGYAAIYLNYGMEETFIFTDTKAEHDYHISLFTFTNSGSDINYNLQNPPAVTVTTKKSLFFSSSGQNKAAPDNGLSFSSVAGKNFWKVNGKNNPYLIINSEYDNHVEINQDWLLLPPINLKANKEVTFSFTSEVRPPDGTSLSILLSPDYHIVQDVKLANWTSITSELILASNSIETFSGVFDVSNIFDNEILTIAFLYANTVNANLSEEWRLDNIRVSGYDQAINSTSVYNTDTATNLHITDITGSTGSMVANNLIIDSAATLTIQKDDVLTVFGDLTIKGKMFIEDGGSLISYGNNDQAAITVKRNSSYPVSSGSYHFIGIPVRQDPDIKGKNIGSFVYRYDEKLPYGVSRWVSADDDILKPGVGYTAVADSFHFTGTPNNSIVENGPLSWTNEPDSDDLKGWHLISNPYSAPIDAGKFLNDHSNILGAVYLWDDGGKSKNGSGSNDDYLVFNKMGAVSGTGNGSIFTGNIASGQGFFVKLRDETYASTSIFFKPEYRIQTGGYNDEFIRLKDKRTSFKISARAEDVMSETLIAFHKEATEGLDREFDALKLLSLRQINLSSICDGTALAIQTLPELSDKHVSLELAVLSQSEVTISAYDIQNLHEYHILLFDQYNRIMHNLSASDYTTMVNPREKDRFSIMIAQEFIDERNPNDEDFQVVTEGDLIRIYGKNNPYSISIHSLSGKKVANSINPERYSGYDQFTIQNPETGLYILTVNSQDITRSKIICIK